MEVDHGQMDINDYTENVNFLITVEDPTTNASTFEQTDENVHLLNTIEVLINEKAQSTAEFNKLRNVCREREIELDNIRGQLRGALRANEELQMKINDQNKSISQFQDINTELQKRVGQLEAQNEDKKNHLEELQYQINIL